MGIIDLIAVTIVCASGVALFATSRHYARAERSDDAERASEAARMKALMDEQVHMAMDAAASAQAYRDEARSELAQRDHARLTSRVENLEAQAGIRRRA